MSRGSAFAAHSSAAAQARMLVVAEHASGLAHLPDCSPAPYGLLSVGCLWLGLPMCWAVSALSTLPFLQGLLLCFTPIHVAVSSQVC
jgi:hypothetical protein